MTFINYAQVSDAGLKKGALAAGYIQLIAVVLLKISALAVVLMVVKSFGNDNLSNFKGLFKKNVVVASAFTFALLGLMGIPFIGGAGFLGKALIITAAIEAGTTMSVTLAFLLIVGSAISIYYYGILIYNMYKEPEDEKPLMPSSIMIFVLVLLVVSNIALMLLGEIIPFSKLF